MKIRLSLIAGIILAGNLSVAPAWAADTISLTSAQRERLVALIKSDKEAESRFETLRRAADNALKDSPNPIKKIQTEGKLKTDPVKIKTSESLHDMGKVHALGYTYAVTNDARYAEKVQEFIVAWAKENVPTGDPIDETTLESMFVAYDLTRSTFSAKEKSTVEGWMRKVAEAEMASEKKGKGTSINNWQSHRLKLIGLVGYALKEKEFIHHAQSGYKKQMEVNLKPDGSSIDFHDRDALHYHIYDVEPLLDLATVAKLNGDDLYSHKAADGASLGHSVKFLVPYCTGEKTHPEFVNSKVAFDKKRAESGDKHYEAGRLFEPKSGAKVFEAAAFFDSSFEKVYFQTIGKTPSRFPTWQFVLNAVRSGGESK